jgi:hypothetical protein
LPGVLVSSRRDRAVVTGCLAYRGDQSERAVNAVGRRRNPITGCLTARTAAGLPARQMPTRTIRRSKS